MPTVDRRHLLVATAGLALPAWAQPGDAGALLRAGGVVIAFRHALAPGTFDPPGFKLGDCGTQRNLNDEGRAQARRIGAWFQTQGLRPAVVRASPWCRCVETAELAFGSASAWPALGSPRAGTEETNAQSLTELRRALAAAARQPGRFEVWVTHMFVLGDLLGVNTASGEGLVLGVQANGQPRLLARLVVS
ncbi:histidine phosphatase family protein [Paucibacter sp. PLA-PC-4]|uniref:histidine phosphatase family protein n=1 Tax=Paucibacter sp. PLA-PC-4 TaxID=2993655 RepID=UPI00224919DB|nr:histidine phosphatase family protein [Paucibacter sp. PLA-PC-4]MCX2862385.1 histidine phosphatase family protein [Paucibacter sp. PLA-PC-4]